MIKGKIKKKIEELERTLNKEGYILESPPQINTEETSNYIPEYTTPNGAKIEERKNTFIKLTITIDCIPKEPWM